MQVQRRKRYEQQASEAPIVSPALENPSGVNTYLVIQIKTTGAVSVRPAVLSC